MATTGEVYPTVGANVDRAGNTAWTNPGNVVSNNTTDATVVVPSDYLVTSGYGFSIPDYATIVGVTVRVEASESGTGSSSYIPQLHSDTTPTLIGSAKTAVTVTGTTKVVSTNGSSSDLWGATLTPAIVNSSGFGVSIWSTDTVNTLAIDYVTIEIQYTVPDFLPREPLFTRVAARRAAPQAWVGVNLLLTTLAGGGDVTVGLTGQSVTASAGTLGPQSDVALSGQAVTSTAGTLSPEISLSLTGESVTASAGTMTATSGVIAALTGEAVTVSAGTLGVTTDVQLAGEAASVSDGTLTPVDSLALTGEAVTSSSGTLDPSASIPLTGEAVTATAGSLTADAGATYLARSPLITSLGRSSKTQPPDWVPNLLTSTLVQEGTVQLGGQSVTTNAGTLAPSISVALTGSQVTVSAGTLSAQIDLAPFKTPLWPEYQRIRTRQIDQFPNLLESTLATTYELNARIDWGNPDRSVKRRQPIDFQNLLMTTLAVEGTSVGLTGQAVTTSAGTLAPSVSVALTGSAVTVSAGTLTASPAAALAGEAVTTAAGTLSVATSVSLSGNQVGTYAGTLTPFATGDVTVALTGETVTCYAGTLTPSGGTVASTRPPGGSGYPVDWQGKRRKARLIERPNLHLRAILDDVVRELYGELTEDDVPAEVQKQAAKIVKPFTEKKAKKLAVPPESAVDWDALEKDAARVKRIIALWREQETRREIDDDDEFMLLID